MILMEGAVFCITAYDRAWRWAGHF